MLETREAQTDIPYQLLYRAQGALFVQKLRTKLEKAGFFEALNARVRLLLDVPCTWALSQLTSGALKPTDWVVVTESRCAEYLEDRWDLRPQALLEGGTLLSELPRHLTRALQGESFRLSSHVPSPLTRTERRVLQGIAFGKEHRELAAMMGVEVSTIKTHQRNLYKKLELKRHRDALFYYLDMHHLVHRNAELPLKKEAFSSLE
jgi:DNA-binding CsgD family transcriptional regulator